MIAGAHRTLVRYLGTGALDTSFDVDGIVPGLDGAFKDVALQADGKM